MNRQTVENLLVGGFAINCTTEEYPKVRRYLQEFAAYCADRRRTQMVAIALAEVVYLDKLHNFLLLNSE